MERDGVTLHPTGEFQETKEYKNESAILTRMAGAGEDRGFCGANIGQKQNVRSPGRLNVDRCRKEYERK